MKSTIPNSIIRQTIDPAAISRYREIILDNRYYLPYFDDRMELPKEEIPKQGNIFNIGEKYILQGTVCDEFDMPTKVYEVKGILGTINGIRLDSLVMKQISGEKSTIFSLTKTDCQVLGIPFERELQIFPQNLNWIKDGGEEVNNEREFNLNDMSSYPVCIYDGTIRKFILKLSGFSTMYDYVVTPNGKHIKKSLFFASLKVRAKKTFIGDGVTSAHITNGRTFNVNFMTPMLGTCSVEGQVIDDLGNIFIEVDLTHPQAYTSTHKSADRKLGVAPHFLEGSIHDLFEVVYQEEYRENISSLNNLLNNIARPKTTIW